MNKVIKCQNALVSWTMNLDLVCYVESESFIKSLYFSVLTDVGAAAMLKFYCCSLCFPLMMSGYGG